MIHLEKDMPLFEHENIRVASKTGNYDDTALIKCYDVQSPHSEDLAYQAQYIKYGNLVYHFNDPKELGEKILSIDSESTHSAASFVRISHELLSQMAAGDLQESSLESAIADEQSLVDDTSPVADTPEVEDEAQVSEKEVEPPPVVPPVTSTSSSTPDIGVPSYQEPTPSVLGTSTAPIVPEPVPLHDATSSSASEPDSIIDEIVPDVVDAVLEAAGATGVVSAVRRNRSVRKKYI